MREIFSLLGVDKRQVSRWKNNPASGNASGGCKKREVIAAAKNLFDMGIDEVESLANKAGLIATKSTEFTIAFEALLKKHPRSYRALSEESGVDERMLRHMRKGKFLRKESLLAVLIVTEADFADIQAVMNAAGYILSDSIPADAVIKWILRNHSAKGLKLLMYINEVLQEFGLPVLMPREYCKKTSEGD